MADQNLEFLSTALETVSSLSTSDSWETDRERAFTKMREDNVRRRNSIRESINAVSATGPKTSVSDIEEKIRILTLLNEDSFYEDPSTGFNVDLRESDPASQANEQRLVSIGIMKLKKQLEKKETLNNFRTQTSNSLTQINKSLMGQFDRYGKKLGKGEEHQLFWNLNINEGTIDAQKNTLENLASRIEVMHNDGYVEQMKTFKDEIGNLNSLVSYFNMMDYIDENEDKAYIQIAKEVNLIEPIIDKETGREVTTYLEALDTATMYAMTGQGLKAQEWVDLAQKSKLKAIEYAKAEKAARNLASQKDIEEKFQDSLSGIGQNIHGYFGGALKVSRDISTTTKNTSKSKELSSRIGLTVPEAGAKTFKPYRESAETELYNLAKEYGHRTTSDELKNYISDIEQFEKDGLHKKAKEVKSKFAAYLLTTEGHKDIVALDFPGTELIGTDVEEAKYENLMKHLVYGVEQIVKYEGQESLFKASLNDSGRQLSTLEALTAP